MSEDQDPIHLLRALAAWDRDNEQFEADRYRWFEADSSLIPLYRELAARKLLEMSEDPGALNGKLRFRISRRGEAELIRAADWMIARNPRESE